MPVSQRKMFQAAMSIIDTRTPDAKRLIPGATGDWEVIIGLEVHAQVTSEAKLFSGASTSFGAAPNAQCQPGRRGHAGHAAGDQRGMRAPGDPHRPRAEGARSTTSRFSTGRTISIPTCRRATRSRSSSSRSSARAWSRFRSARTAKGSSRTSRSASSGCISSRTPASRCTTSIRPCPMSTSTARASR